MSSSVARERSLVAPSSGYVEGWMDEDAAAAAGQLFGKGPAGLLVVDHRHLLSSTARVVGAELGELHFKVWMAIITLHVGGGQPASGAGQSSIGELSRLIWGVGKQTGGSNTRKILRALTELDSARFTLPGYDTVNDQVASGVGRTSLFTDLYIDGALLSAFEHRGEHGLTAKDFGQRTGGKGCTVSWQLHKRYCQRLAQSELRRFDWAKAQQLRGVALALWMVFGAPRLHYRPVLEDAGLQMLELALSAEHCHALGVRAGTDAARRRTLNEAGPRVCAADRSFVSFEAHGGRGAASVLRVVRTADLGEIDGEPPEIAPSDQLMLQA